MRCTVAPVPPSAQTAWRLGGVGGRLTSGLAADSGTVAGKATTYTMGLGTDNQV